MTLVAKLAALVATLALALSGDVTSGAQSRALGPDGCPPPGDGNAIVDYIDFVGHEGRTYLADPHAARSLPQSAVGNRVGTVRCELSRIVPAPEYLTRDGDAGFLPAGTALYAMRGYPPSFRLLAAQDGAYRIYEVDTAPRARTGGDLLPIAGLVRRIDVLDGDTATRVLGKVTDHAEIVSVVAALVKAPVDQDRPVTQNPLFLRFHLADGTSVQRAWFPRDSVVGRGIVVPRSFTLALQRTMARR